MENKAPRVLRSLTGEEFNSLVREGCRPTRKDDTPVLMGQAEMPWRRATPGELRTLVAELWRAADQA